MPYIRSKRYPELFKPNTSRWWCFIPRPEGGKAERVSTGHTDELAAHRWYLERVRAPSSPVEAEAKEGKQRTLELALAARIDWLEAARKTNDKTRKRRSAATIQFYDKKGKPLVNILGADTLLSAIGHEEIRRYIVTRSATCKATTIGHELTTLSMAMKLARKDGVECPVFKDIVPEDFAVRYVPRTRWLPEDEADRVLAVLAPNHAGKVAFMIATGATFPSEVVTVTPSMVVASRHEVHIPGTKRDTRDRHIVVPRYARKYLTLALKHADGGAGLLFRPWVSVRRDLRAAAVRASTCADCVAAQTRRPARVTTCKGCLRLKWIAPFSPNDLRRTFAQWLVRSGVPYELAYPMMGHGSERMLQLVYGKRDARSVAALVDVALRKAPKGARRMSA